MSISYIEKKLNEAIDFELVPVEEYQDKYYFLKKIKNIFPELTNKQIVNAINYANVKVKFFRRKKKYIKALSYKIFLA